MSPPLRNLLLLGAAMLALAGGYWLAKSMRPPETTHTTALAYGGGEMIDFSLPEIDGKIRSLKEWRGKVIVLNFWATWCPPCREEIPLLIALQKKYAADGLQVVSVAVDNKTAVMLYRQSAGINYPVLLGNDGAMDLAAQYGDRMGSLPYSVIMTRSGSIAVRKLGAFDEAELDSLVKPLLTPLNATSAQL
ncbi:MAG: TlpA family protein disulfide reductase [Sulfuricaulis sp.]